MLVKFQEDQHSLFKNKKKEIKVNPRWRTKVERHAWGDEFGILEAFHVIGGQVHSSRDPVEEGLGDWQLVLPAAESVSLPRARERASHIRTG